MTQMITFLQAATCSTASVRAIAPVVFQRNKTITAGSGAAYQDLLSTPTGCAPAAGQIINTGCFDLKVKLSYLNSDDCDDCTTDAAKSTTLVPPTPQAYGALRTGYYVGVEAARVIDTTIETGTSLQTFNSYTVGVNQTLVWDGVGTFSNTDVVAPGTYQGLDGTNAFGAQGSPGEATLQLLAGTEANYFGMFYHTQTYPSAFINFYKGTTLVASVPGNVATLFSLPATYNGNPLSAGGTVAGDGNNYKHSYVNIWLNGTTYDRIVFGGANNSIDNMRVGLVSTLYPPIAQDVELIIPKNSAFPLPEGLVSRIQMQTVNDSGVATNATADQKVSWYSSYTPGCNGCVTL